MDSDVFLARQYLIQGYTAVAVKNGRVLAAERGPGVKPFFRLYHRLGSDLKGSSVADRVAGRAVALAAVSAGCSALHGDVLSLSALELLEKAGIAPSYITLVPCILGRKGQGKCPVEALSEGITDVRELLQALREFWGDEAEVATDSPEGV